jgi:hypothetical protein
MPAPGPEPEPAPAPRPACGFPQYVVNFLRSWQYQIEDGIPSALRPVIVIAARLHPSESGSSFAVEGLIRTVFANDNFGRLLRRNFSWLIFPMVNPDGVVCGLYRTSLSGDNLNRVWKDPNPNKRPVVTAILDVVDALHRTRPIPLFIDFHG